MPTGVFKTGRRNGLAWRIMREFSLAAGSLRAYNRVEQEEQGMSYCAICGCNHDPDLPCFDASSQSLRSAGVNSRRYSPIQEFRKTARRSDRWVLKCLVTVLAIITALIILIALFERRAL